jgi:hypothetical protein
MKYVTKATKVVAFLGYVKGRLLGDGKMTSPMMIFPAGEWGESRGGSDRDL